MPKRNPSIDRLTIKHFWAVARLFKRDFALSWFTPLSTLGMSIAVPYLTGKILGNLANPHFNEWPYIYALVAAAAVSVAANWIAYGALFSLQPKAMAYLHEEVLSTLLKRSTAFHSNRVSGKLVSEATDYPLAFNQLSGSLFSDIIPFLLIVILGIGIVSFNSPVIGLVLLTMTALAVGSGIYFRKRMEPHRIIRHDAGRAVTAHLADTLVNNQAVKSFAAEDREMDIHRRLGSALFNARFHDWHQFATDGAYRIAGLLLFQIVFIITIVHEVHANPALLATGIFAFTYTMTISNRLFQIGIMMRTIEEAFLLAMPMTEMLRESIEITDKPGAKDLKVTTGAVTFDDVSFHYQDNPKQEKVFDDLQLRIKPGEKIGLVGPSGGGKTTLTKLLLRFEDIQGGAILIDKQNIAEVTQASLRSSIAYVPQEPLLFHRTIRENIAYAHPNATEKMIFHAAKQAYADEFITQLPNGYDTVVGERGVKLSGGQRQRIAIARAILKDAPVLVLDEATSALDSESEVAIQAALWELMQGRTAIVVAHRLSTIQKMDRIIVLADGKIIEQGTHKQLLKNGGLYARLWNHQSGGFIEE